MSSLECIRAWTDYPIESLGDVSGKLAPVRPCIVLEYDGDKYCVVRVSGVRELIKTAYVYYRKGRYGKVPWISRRRLCRLPRIDYSRNLNAIELTEPQHE